MPETPIENLESAIENLERHRKSPVRSFQWCGHSQPGILQQGLFVEAVNELQDLITDVAIRRALERMKRIAQEQAAEAERILGKQ